MLSKDRETRPHCLALLLVGVTWPTVSPRTPVVSYTTFSPSPWRLILLLLAGKIATAVCFSVALFRQVFPTWDYPAPHPMEPGLSSPHVWDATAWPTWATAIMITYCPPLSRERETELRIKRKAPIATENSLRVHTRRRGHSSDPFPTRRDVFEEAYCFHVDKNVRMWYTILVL